jgi:hypothetical protein
VKRLAAVPRRAQRAVGVAIRTSRSPRQ